MKQLTGNQVRQMFLDYFKSKGHMIEPMHKNQFVQTILKMLVKQQDIILSLKC